MRAHYIILVAAATSFATFGDVSATIGLGQNEISGMTAAAGIFQPHKAARGDGNRFLRKRDAGAEDADGEDVVDTSQEEEEEEERGITDLAAKLDDTLTIKTLRSVHQKKFTDAWHHLQGSELSTEKRDAILQFLTLSADERKAVLHAIPKQKWPTHQ
ncbi:unnamed protein product [Phytophthora lilii]|uniref:RxLR effector protein n=1 Tax=Phytophthora lilii TaxID=2077276 RepID=A0A9W6TAH2_9STRA|nr:unnamed protein product [Phytophthora lilii]